MRLLGTCLFGLAVLIMFSSCGLFRPAKPYEQGNRNDPLVLDSQHPEKHPETKKEPCKPVDYLLPWRLKSCER